MKIIDFKKQRVSPVKDMIAFQWLKPKTKSGLVLPDVSHDIGLRLGRFYIGEILAIGKQVQELQKGELILVHEYGIKNYEGTWQEDEIYFIEEKSCTCKILDFPGHYIDLRGKVSRKELEEMGKIDLIPQEDAEKVIHRKPA